MFSKSAGYGANFFIVVEPMSNDKIQPGHLALLKEMDERLNVYAGHGD